MSSEAVEPAIARPPAHAAVGAWRAGADAERARAAREVWRALWASRLIVWVAGVGAVAELGAGGARHALDPPGLTTGLGSIGDLLAAPAARWDAAWYLVIAHFGYRPELGSLTASRTAFFPLYPLGVRGLSDAGVEPVIAGVALSLAALAAGLYGLHRLVAMEATRMGWPDGGDVARLAVLLTALAPMAFYFSAVYSESLYLGVSVWAFLQARRGRWASAGALGALAAATRSTGVMVVVGLGALYLYGPREDRQPELAPRARGERGKRDKVCSRMAELRPRYRLRGDALWLALAPVGVGLYMGHLALAGGDALAPLHAEAAWSRHFAGPYGGVWDGAKAAIAGARQLLSGQSRHVYFPAAGGSPLVDASHNLLLFAFLCAAAGALAGVLRLLPGAYGVYVLAALAVPLSYPVASQPLMSLPRFLVVLFPLNVWLAAWLAARSRMLRRGALAMSSLAMMFFAGAFSTWHWVA
jgi:Mannosyltransferase (PIG-V)